MRTSPIKAAGSHFALIFLLGFALGTLRVIWMAPMMGEVAAVLAELPVMLAASYFAARWLTRRFDITSSGDAALMGGTAFALLMLAEAILSRALSGTGIAEWFAALFAVPGIYGLAGQIGFGVMPLLVRRGD
ncbi:hypothetical protein [Allopontixanthobacter sp.]|uniref:hypothetical protein n=1 Tax=Allopontixanthobacter sp. TaxID=2906452 RepID=UPI002ABCB720|nr:hypothetical protein [Allopontixanthobacter sp.]MDZ4307251.1 hypothetical protein [Allopontixanthobacter sp.]